MKIYTDGLGDVTAKLAHVADELETLKLRDALLVGEGVVGISGKDQRTPAEIAFAYTTFLTQTRLKMKLLRKHLT